MAETERVPASTILREVGVKEENTQTAKNAFVEDSSEYGAGVVPEEINGAVKERTKMGVMNMFNESNIYRNPDVDGL